MKKILLALLLLFTGLSYSQTSLAGTSPASSYGGLLHFGNNTGLTTSLQTVYDGLGNVSALQLSTLGANVVGTFTINGVSAGTGTITSIAFGNGLTGGTVTSTGTVTVDTTVIANKTFLTNQYQPKGLYLIPTDSTAFRSFSDLKYAPIAGNVLHDSSGYLVTNIAGEGLKISYHKIHADSLNTVGNAYFGGNVGIGTTAPGYKLEVSGDVFLGTQAYTDASAGLIVSKPSSSALATRIDVIGNNDNQDVLFIKTDYLTGTGVNWGFGQRNDTYFGNTAGSFQIVGARYIGGVAQSTYNVPLIAQPNGNLILVGGAANANNGNVGIGTTAPAYQLQDNSSILNAFAVSTTGGGVKASIDSSGNYTGTWTGNSIDTTYTNAVSKINSGVGIIATKNSKDYTINVDTNTIATKGYEATLIPTQTGNAGLFLGTNGTNTSWNSIPGGGDMLKSAYATQSGAAVDSSRFAESSAWSGITGKPTLGTMSAADSTYWNTKIGVSQDSLASGDTIINCSVAKSFIKVLGSSKTYKLTNTSNGQIITVAIANDSTYTTAWTTDTNGVSANIGWYNAMSPAQTSGSYAQRKVDLYTFTRLGDKIYGSVKQNLYSGTPSFSSNIIPVETSNTSPLTVTASSQATLSYQAYMAFDNDTVSEWKAANGYPQWLTVDFGYMNIRTVGKYEITASTTEYPATWTFQGSNDNIAWTTLDTRTGVSFASVTVQDFTFSNSTGYRYYRIYITSGTSQVGIEELQMFVYQ